MDSRGGVTGGSTMSDFLAGYAREGYDSDFVRRGGGRLQCSSCKDVMDAREVRLQSLRRVEGVSEPDEMAAVAALECPHCGARGTATFCFGTMCPPEDGIILRAFEDQRFSTMTSRQGRMEDHSLVRDTGWLPGPRNG